MKTLDINGIKVLKLENDRGDEILTITRFDNGYVNIDIHGLDLDGARVFEKHDRPMRVTERHDLELPELDCETFFSVSGYLGEEE